MPKKTAKDAKPKFSSSSAGSAPRPNLLKCPKCGQAMQPMEHEGVEIDRCVGCKGMWFDLLELEDLKKLQGAEKLDIGDAYKGSVHNKTERYDCPVCAGEMVRMVDREQRHIWIETCASCGGVYLDAGEFRDLKEREFKDFLKALVTRARR
jgi:Zn-finger nucleic acid-binding protein